MHNLFVSHIFPNENKTAKTDNPSENANENIRV